MKKYLLGVLVLLFGHNYLVGQVSLTNGSPSTTIDFNATITGVNNAGFTGSGFQPAPGIGQLDSDAWEISGLSDGNLNFGGTQTGGDFARGTSGGGVTTGGLYGGTGIGSPFLMVQPTGSDFTPGTITLRVQNNGTSNITALDVNYDIYYRNDQGRANSFNFSWSLDNVAYTPAGALDFTSPAAATGGAWNTVARSTTISSLSITPGSYIYVRWESNDVSGSGSRDELGVDNINLNASYGTSNTITTGAVTGAPFSVDCSTTDNGTVAFTSTGTFTGGNTYTAQLSDASGSFASPTNIGTLASTANSGTINITIPAATLTGTGYRIRVVSDSPITTGTSSTAFTITSTCTGTDLEPGDLVFVGFDTYVTGGSDKLVITNLVPLLPGTEFTLANAVYEHKAAANASTGKWYNGNNSSPCGAGTYTNDLAQTTVTYNGPGTLTEGSVICIYLCSSGACSITGYDLNGSSTSLFTDDGGAYVQISSSQPDAIFLMQGTFSGALVDGDGDTYRTFTGDVLGGIQTRGTFQARTVAGNNGGCRVSRIHPQIECLGISTGGASDAYYGYYNPGETHNASQRDLLSNIVNIGSTWTMATTGLVNGDDVPTCGNTFTVTSFSVPGKWTGASDNNWFFCRNWENFTVPDDSTDVQIPGTASNISNIDYTAAYSDYYADTARCRNLLITGETLRIEASDQNVLMVNGDLTIATTAGSELDMDDGNNGTVDGRIHVLGDWINNRGEADFDEGNGTIILDQGLNQNISIIGAATEIFYNLLINKTAGNVTLNDNVEVGGASTNPIANRNGVLTLTSGDILTGTNYIYVTNPAITGISGGSAASYVDGNLRRHTNTINLYDFPTGDAGYYMRSGVRTTNTSENVVEINAHNVGYGTYTPLEVTLFAVSTQRWWDVSKISGSTPVSVRLYWQSFMAEGITDVNDLVVAHWSDRDHGGAPSVLQWWNRGRSVANSSALVNPGWVESSETMVTYSPFTFGTTTSDNPLPVELTSFDLSCHNANITATWSTSSELNNDYFELQGSKNGFAYESIVRVDGNGNSNVMQEYESSFSNDKNYAYIRLTQTDLNGAITEYDPQYISCTPSQTLTVTYLNGQIQIVLPDGVSDNLSLSLNDLSGKIIQQNALNAKSWSSYLTIALHTILSSGIYVISIIDQENGETYHTKFFVN